ncbi:S1C family serine protease [Taibaiella koreensis]|uniref:S1C family serine protease n=1 Tax=Taibaiella koreensis TaxID=1268548 RepID=UPI000E59B6CE|nr:serine protease [Taibaiella koreensis]
MKKQVALLLFLSLSLSVMGQTGENKPVAPESTRWTEDTIRAYLSSKKIDPIEGIYKSYQRDGMPYYKVGILKAGSQYKAVIIETEVPGWQKGEVKATFEPGAMRGVYATIWYWSDKTPYETFAHMDLESESILTIVLKDQKTLQKREDHFIKIYPAATSNDVLFKKDNSKSSGSGFFLTTGGIIATSAHVILDASGIEVTASRETGTFTYKAKLLLTDIENDIALLQITDSQFKTLPAIPYGIAENADIGVKVFTIGYPLNEVMGRNYKVTDGIISATSGVADDARYYQISVPLQPGNSGGPLFNQSGNVVGITSAKLKTPGTKTENVNYAVKSAYLLQLYQKLPKAPKIPSATNIPDKELQDQVKILKKYVCLIKVY